MAHSFQGISVVGRHRRRRDGRRHRAGRGARGSHRRAFRPRSGSGRQGAVGHRGELAKLVDKGRLTKVQADAADPKRHRCYCVDRVEARGVRHRSRCRAARCEATNLRRTRTHRDERLHLRDQHVVDFGDGDRCVVDAIRRALVGMHFFNPAPVMALVEVVSGLATSRRWSIRFMKPPSPGANAGAGALDAGFHRQPRGAAVLCGSTARAQRTGRRCRDDRPHHARRGRLQNGPVRVDGPHRPRRQLRGDRVGVPCVCSTTSASRLRSSSRNWSTQDFSAASRGGASIDMRPVTQCRSAHRAIEASCGKHQCRAIRGVAASARRAARESRRRELCRQHARHSRACRRN